MRDKTNTDSILPTDAIIAEGGMSVTAESLLDYNMSVSGHRGDYQHSIFRGPCRG